MTSRLPHHPDAYLKCQTSGCSKGAEERRWVSGKATLTTTYCHQHFTEFVRLVTWQRNEFGGGRREYEDGTSRLRWTDRRGKGNARYFYASKRGYHSY